MSFSITDSLRIGFAKRLPQFRWRERLASMIEPRKGSSTVDVFGFPMTLDMSDYIQRNIAMAQYETFETEIIKASLHSGDTFVDIGANIGYYTALAASLVGPAGKVLSFEPDPQCYRVLVKNFSAAPYITCINRAVSESVGKLRLYMPPESEHNHDSSWLAYCEGMTAFESETTTLDIELRKYEHVHLLKLDIEGHEPQAIRGGRRILESGRVGRVLCELNERLLRLAGSSPCELVELLQGCGFKLESRIGNEAFANGLFVHDFAR